MAAAVATRVERTEKKTTSSAPQRAKSPRVHIKRRIKARAPMMSMVALVLLCLVGPFAYTNVYAVLKTTSYARSDYESKYWQEKVANERLQVQVNQYSSPGRIKLAAAKLGMIPAKDYDYMDQPQTKVASSE